MLNYSLIIPHFNSSKKLFRLLDSIPEREDIEVIIIDDGSRTSEKKKIEQFLLNKNYGNTIFINNEENFNAGRCRNQGIKYSNAKWLIFSDSDDYFLDDFILYLDMYRERDDLDIVFFKVSSETELGEKTSSRHYQWNVYVDEFLEKKINRIQYLHAVPWGKMILRSSVISGKVFFDEIKVANDVMFSVRIGLQAEAIGVDKNTIYCVTENENSLTTKKAKSDMFLRLSIWINRYVFLKKELPREKFYNLSLSGFPIAYSIYKELGILSFIQAIFLLKKKKIRLLSEQKVNSFFKRGGL